jgi:ABC-type glycerol-3-phosphate transport system substrate-binding protein
MIKTTTVKKYTAFLLLLLAVCVIIFSGCNSNNNDNKKSSDKPIDTETENPGAADLPADDIQAETQQNRIMPDLPETDFNGYNFRILSRGPNYNPHWFARDIYADEVTGDTINDAVYQRNRTIENKYNINIVNIPENGDLTAKASKAIKAGDDMFDIMSHGLQHISSLMTSGGLYDLHTIPYLDLSKPWWDQKAKEQLTIHGKLFATISDYIILDKDATWILMFNKQLIKNYGLDDPYLLVKNGDWTMDKMYEMMSAASADLNGDGKMDENDQWGLVSQYYNALAFYNGAGECISKVNSEGQPEITLYNQRAVDVCEKIEMLQANKNVTLNADAYEGKISDVWDGLQLVVFNTDRGLFYYAGMNRVTLLRNMETDFGIIPPPKFNKEQDGYHVAIHSACTGSVAIPGTVENIERTGIILEALTAESKYTLLPAYYDISLKTKFARDDESSEMLDLIFANRIYDVGQLFGWGNGEGFFHQLSQSKNTLASYWEKSETKMLIALGKTMEAFDKID